MDPLHIAAFKRVRTSEYLSVEEDYQKLKKFIDDYEAVKSSLTLLSEKCRHPVMVPFGSVAFMSGSLVHTNDVLVLLGDNWFVEQSAAQTIDILSRRIAALQSQAEKLQARMQQIKTELGYAQGLAEEGSDTVEIVEPYDEQFEQRWKMQHDANWHKYRRETKESSTVSVSDGTSSEKMEYEEIVRRLEQLEKIEEAKDEDGDDVHPAAESGIHEIQEMDSCIDGDVENSAEQSQALMINFKHSLTGSQIRERSANICSPADIYDKFCAPSTSSVSHTIAAHLDQPGETPQLQDMSSEIPDSRSCIESQVTVSCASEMLPSSAARDIRSCAAEPTARKISKFKASRLKK